MERRTRLKTFSHLLENRRLPSEYEIVTSKLHYYTDRGFEVTTPIARWYQRYQKGSRFQCKNWEKFQDPRATTYTSYTALQSNQERFVDELFRSMESHDYLDGLPREWVDQIGVELSALRFAYHGLQMASAYLGQLAPSGRLTIAFLFQAADEMRKIQRFAYRLALHAKTDPSLVEQGQRAWQEDPAWQPLRELVERLLVTYDWGEAFIALNLCVKPLLDYHFLNGRAAEARARNDYLWSEVLGSMNRDSDWQKSWTRALLDVAGTDAPGNTEFIQVTTQKWTALTQRALSRVITQGAQV